MFFAPFVPEVSLRVQARFGGSSANSTVVGTTKEYQFVQTVPVQYGRFLTDDDDRQAARVAVLGALVAEDLFGKENVKNAVGRTIEVNGQPLQVVGVLRQLGGPSRPTSASWYRSARRGCALPGARTSRGADCR